jgi:hypothetical protein
MTEFRYYIIAVNVGRIAAFRNKADRDVCLDALREYFADAEFTDSQEECLEEREANG